MFINFSFQYCTKLNNIVHGIWCLRGKKMKMKMLQHYMVVKAQTLINGNYRIPIRDSNRFDSLCESIRFAKKSAFRFTSCHAVFLVYLLYSLSQK